MLWSEARDYLHDRNKELEDALRQVELIGEIPVDEAEVAKLAEALGMFWQSVSQYQHAFAVMLVGVARYDYDHEFWPHVSQRVGRELTAAAQGDCGKQFEGYLAREGFQTFHHLRRDESALRFVAPILGHTIVPIRLVPQFMERAIWPAVQRGDYSAEAVQQRFATQPPASTAKPIVRFILHGGGVARDVIERSITFALAVTGGEDDEAELPAWLGKAIRTWVSERRSAGAMPPRPPGHRRLTPVLKYDTLYGRVIVELPYSDEDGAETWDVRLLGTGVAHSVPAWVEAWRRTGHAREVEIDRPFDTLQVTLRNPDDVLLERHYPGLRKEWPAIFFDQKTGRALPSTGTVTGSEWYVLRRTDSPLTASPPETLHVREALGPPLGQWDGYTVERLQAAGAATLAAKLLTSSATWWLAKEAPGPRLEAAEVPSYLAAGDAVVAFEDCLPQIILPAPAASETVDAYVARWRLSAIRPGEGPVTVAGSALSYSQRDDLEVAVELAEVIPGRDIGNWSLQVMGPIGRGLTAQLALLPRMTFLVDARAGIAGLHLAPSKVHVTTREGIRVLEVDDAATASGDGWELEDRNRNGRIPFTVIDSDTGRETAAMVVLPTVQWQWFRTGEASSEPNQPLRLSPDARQGVRLMARGAGDNVLRLSLVDSGGSIGLEDRQLPGQGRGAVFGAGKFVTAAEALGLPRAKLLLALVSQAGVTLDEAEVGEIALTVEPLEIEAEFIDGVGVVQWRQAWQAGGEQARLASLSRPWDEPISAGASLDGMHYTALYRSDRMVPGRYQLALFQDDPWTGIEQLGPAAEVRLGSEAAIVNRARGLPRTAEGVLESALLLTDTALRNSVVAGFTRSLGQYQFADLVDVIARALRQRRATELLTLSWASVAKNLTQQHISPLPLVQTLASHAGAEGLDAFCSMIGLDRWPALHGRRNELAGNLRTQAWAVWMPLGAALDLPDAQSDADARLRCSVWLGFERLEARLCPACRTRNELGDEPCGECESPYDAAKWDEALIRECGTVEGLAFRPIPQQLEEMRRALSPLPGKPLDADGWISSALETLESLAVEDEPAAEGERDAVVDQYLRHCESIESALTQALGADWLRFRLVQAMQYPWAFCARMSLAVALSRRLLARAALPDGFPTSETDELAAWLLRWMRPVFEHDLCVAELICCRRMDWIGHE